MQFGEVFSGNHEKPILFFYEEEMINDLPSNYLPVVSHNFPHF
jgi:hypothetical protein